MSKALRAAIALVVSGVLQVALAPHLSVGGVVPDLPLLVVVTLAMVEGPIPGCAAGFAAGLMHDFLGTGPIGPSAMVLCLVGYLAGSLGANMFAEGWLLPVTVVFIATIAAEISYALFMTTLGEGVPFWAGLSRVTLPEAVYNTALALLAYPWLARFLRREPAVTTFRRLA